MIKKILILSVIFVFNFVTIGILSTYIYNKYIIVDVIDNKYVDDIKDEVVEEIKKVKISMVGDLLYEEPYYDSVIDGDDKSIYLSNMKEYFLNDDLSLANLEVVITDGNLKVSGEGYSFCAPQYVGQQIIDVGLDVLSTANNHANDRGLQGRISTMEYFKNNSNIMTVGTYDINRDIEKNVIEKNGIKFGFLAYTYGTNVTVSKDLRYSLGIFKDPSTYTVTAENKELIREEVSRLRELVDCLIVFMHWGKEFTYKQTNEQLMLASYLNELGVDIVVGTHSHCIQPIEWIRTSSHDTLVYYSLGNFVSADNEVVGASLTFDNAYQFGLMSQLEVSLDDSNKLVIDNISTEPIINYYDSNEKNFLLIPYSKYEEIYETNHFRYKYGFDKEFIYNAYSSVISEEFR